MAASHHESVTRIALELKEQDLRQVRREAEKAIREAQTPMKAARQDHEAAIQRAEEAYDRAKVTVEIANGVKDKRSELLSPESYKHLVLVAVASLTMAMDRETVHHADIRARLEFQYGLTWRQANAWLEEASGDPATGIESRYVGGAPTSLNWEYAVREEFKGLCALEVRIGDELLIESYTEEATHE